MGKLISIASGLIGGKKGIALIIAAAVLAVGVYCKISSLTADIRCLESTNQAQARTIGEVTAANAGLALDIDELRQEQVRTHQALLEREGAYNDISQQFAAQQTELRRLLERPENRDWADYLMPDDVSRMLRADTDTDNLPDPDHTGQPAGVVAPRYPRTGSPELKY